MPCRTTLPLTLLTINLQTQICWHASATQCPCLNKTDCEVPLRSWEFLTNNPNCSRWSETLHVSAGGVFSKFITCFDFKNLVFGTFCSLLLHNYIDYFNLLKVTVDYFTRNSRDTNPLWWTMATLTQGLGSLEQLSTFMNEYPKDPEANEFYKFFHRFDPNQ